MPQLFPHQLYRLPRPADQHHLVLQQASSGISRLLHHHGITKVIEVTVKRMIGMAWAARDPHYLRGGHFQLDMMSYVPAQALDLFARSA